MSDRGIRARRAKTRWIGSLVGVLLDSAALSSPAWAVVNVGTETELRNAIFASNGGADPNINVTANITPSRCR